MSNLKLLTGFLEALLVRGVYHIYEHVGVVEVVAPVGPAYSAV